MAKEQFQVPPGERIEILVVDFDAPERQKPSQPLEPCEVLPSPWQDDSPETASADTAPQEAAIQGEPRFVHYLGGIKPKNQSLVRSREHAVERSVGIPRADVCENLPQQLGRGRPDHADGTARSHHAP